MICARGWIKKAVLGEIDFAGVCPPDGGVEYAPIFIFRRIGTIITATKGGCALDAVTAVQLTKTYGDICAVRDLTLSIPQGGVFGLLGVRGAGKTSVVRMLCGLAKPTGGECSVLGRSPAKNPAGVHAVCGVMVESAKLYAHMTGQQNLLFFAQAAGMGDTAAARRASGLMKDLELWEARDLPVSQYSTGMLQKLSLARAMVNYPSVLLLDEPTSGLDYESAHAVNALVSKFAEREDTTVLLCTRQLHYAQHICTEFGILDNGELVASGDFQSLREAAGCRAHAEFRLREGDSLEQFHTDETSASAPAFHNGWWRAELRGEEEMPFLLRQIVEKGHDVLEARLVEPTLQDIYKRTLEHRSKKEGETDAFTG